MSFEKTITLDMNNFPFRFEDHHSIRFKVPKKNSKILGTAFSKIGKGRSRFISVRLITGSINYVLISDTKRNKLIGIEHYAL